METVEGGRPQSQNTVPSMRTATVEDLLEDNPSYVTPHIGLGSIYESLDRIEEARSAYSEGLEKVEMAMAETRAIIAAIGEIATAEEAGELQAQISRLPHERATLIERLRLLPDGTSP